MTDDFTDLFGQVSVDQVQGAQCHAGQAINVFPGPGCKALGLETPHPTRGAPAQAAPPPPRGLSEISTANSGEVQVADCESRTQHPAAKSSAAKSSAAKSSAAKSSAAKHPAAKSSEVTAAKSPASQTPSPTTPPAAGNGSSLGDQRATGTEVACTPSPAAGTSEKAPVERSMTATELRAYIAALDLTRLTFQQKKGLIEGLAAKERYEAENMLERYAPYPKQVDFHAAGVGNRERLLMAGSQLGKTFSAAAEMAMHLTGLYPDWWQGKIFATPVRALAAGVTSQLVRDSMQVLLCGAPAKPLGHGMIPKRCIEAEPVMARSITGAFDTIKVRHVSGGESSLYLRSYEAGREKVQAMTLDIVWLDEEPDTDYYLEALTRTNVATGPVFMTFTPLKGMSSTVGRFLLEGHGNVTTMTIDDVAHYTREEKDAIIAQYPAHEREARTKGIPTMGSGKVYPFAEETIMAEAFPIPDHWPRLAAMDLGWAHDTAVVWVAWDRDADTVYVYDSYNAKETTIPVHASAIKARGDWPVSWPHDGHAAGVGSNHGEPLAQLYRNEGVNMRPEHAQFPESQTVGERKMSRISTEAAVQEILTRMEGGRFKVFSHLAKWFEEFRLYHRKDGVLVKVRDDLMTATHKAIMDLRFAEVKMSASKSINHERRSDSLY